MKAQTPLDFLIVGIKVTNAKDIHCKISEEPSSKNKAINIKICGIIVALCKEIHPQRYLIHGLVLVNMCYIITPANFISMYTLTVIFITYPCGTFESIMIAYQQKYKNGLPHSVYIPEVKYGILSLIGALAKLIFQNASISKRL